MNRICENCGVRVAEHRHHKFSQTKLNRKHYPKHIDRPGNIVYLCSICHLNKSIPKWTEKEFCAYFNLEIISKIIADKLPKKSKHKRDGKVYRKYTGASCAEKVRHPR